MRTTIDRAGRIVIPKAIRDKLLLSGGGDVEIEIKDDHLVISAVPVPKRMVIHEDGRPVLVADGPVPVLTAEMVRETLESIRR